MTCPKQVVGLLVSVLLVSSFLPFGSLVAEEEASCSKAVLIMQRLAKRSRIMNSSEKEAAYKEALGLCDRMAEIHHNYGIFLDGEGRSGEARAQFERALELEEREQYRIAVGRSYLREGEYTKADESFHLVLDNDPENIKALQGLAVVAAQTGQLDEGIQYLTKALSLGEEDAITHFNLGALYERKKMREEALSHYTQAVRQDPNHYPSLVHQGILLLKRGDVKEGVNALEQAAMTGGAGDTGKVYSALGAGYERLGNLNKAELALRKALASDSSSRNVRANLALVLVKLDHPAQALELYDEAPNLDPADQPYIELVARGLAEQKLGKFSEAEAHLKKALQQQPKDLAVLSALAELYEQTGKREKAKSLEERIKKLSK